MQTINKGGDVLARGNTRCQFPPADGVSQRKWDRIFDDFDPEAYKTNVAVDENAVPAEGKSTLPRG